MFILFVCITDTGGCLSSISLIGLLVVLREVSVCIDNRALRVSTLCGAMQSVDPLALNDVYISRTAQLTSRRGILNIYSTNILTEYFKHVAHFPFFLSSRCRLFHNAIFFGSCNIHILNTGCVLKF